MQRALVLPVLSLVMLLSVVAAGCGGSDNASSAESWANDVCTELDTWATSVSTTIRNVMAQGGGVSRADLQAAANQASSATSQLVDGLQKIGAPDVDSGDDAKQQVDQLGDDLRRHGQEVRSLVENAPSGLSGIVTTAQSVLGQIGAAADQVKATLSSLEALGSDLKTGIQQSDACTELRHKDFSGGS